MRSRLLLLVLASAAACGDNEGGPLRYSNPAEGGKLRLIHSKVKPTSTDVVVLDFVVGDQPLTGYSVGFDLPADHRMVRLTDFTPGTALDPGSSPPAAKAALPATGPLADMLVTGLSQKASGPGAVAVDTTLSPGSVLYTIRLQMVGSAPDGVVFDGSDPDFHLPSGGMRDRTGTTVVEPGDVAIGKLEVDR
jgi:hypothetical protein